MKKVFLLSSLLLLGIFVGTSFALPSGSIYDTYLHPKDSEWWQQDDDVIGRESDFDILGHRWVEKQGLEIFLKWNLGEDGYHLNAMLGDVFFYDPTGTSLEYFVPVRNHIDDDYDGNELPKGYDGNKLLKGKVYHVEDTNLSNYYYPLPDWETRRYGDDEIVTGKGAEAGQLFDITTSVGVSPYNTIALDFIDGDILDLYGRSIRFSFTCANDVHAPVPEPATMLLLGFGLIGIVGLGRRRFKINKN